MKDNMRITRFVGFHEGLQDSFDEMSQDYDKAIDKAETIYIAHGPDAAQAAREDQDRAVAREAAEDYLRANTIAATESDD